MAVNKVLLVDDSPTDLANLKGIIQDTGCTTITATTGSRGDRESEELSNLTSFSWISSCQTWMVSKPVEN